MVSCIQIVVLHTIILVSKQLKNFQHKTKQFQRTMLKTLDHIGQTKLMLQFLICIDNVFIITSMLEIAIHDDTLQLDDIYIVNICVLSIFSLSLIVNGLAFAGVVNTKRILLIPWFIVYMMFNIILTTSFLWDVFTNPFSITRINHACLLLMVMFIWRHMQVTFNRMGLKANSILERAIPYQNFQSLNA